MISVTSITGNYILQPHLLEKHTITLNWLSRTLLWKGELATFQKMLDERAPFFTSIDDKKRIDHFQNIIIYYSAEVILELQKKLRGHEKRLANMLETKDELNTRYFTEHDDIMSELESFATSFAEFRQELFQFLQLDE